MPQKSHRPQHGGGAAQLIVAVRTQRRERKARESKDPTPKRETRGCEEGGSSIRPWLPPSPPRGPPLACVLKKLPAEPSCAPGATYAALRHFFSSGDDYDTDEYASSDSEDDVAVDDRSRARDISDLVFFALAGRIRVGRREDAAARASLEAPQREWWVADDAVTLKVPMPGMEKEHVKVWADQNVLVIDGEGEKETADGKEEVRVRARDMFGCPVTVPPRVKDQERKGVFDVAVE
ncbi:hypothetical protein PR202_ga17721 [Eleusine coracana subsp. coracana]|uniref:SHSP domain-containing protein n=1 Tax=Eleusine coracana subsp. coracana TaxID=191504 RepID=A0AAV5CRJ4_ELECO|nr:hypothetical protein PR202_ga17474 [Eleusine coracana subsp. coracana]GJN00532.1 hypothetical protein PR202_ga17721 [Eleusine coracana subsp. coracana]